MNLYNLPDELLVNIVQQIDSQHALYNVIQTSRRFYALAIHPLYRLNAKGSLDSASHNVLGDVSGENENGNEEGNEGDQHDEEMEVGHEDEDEDEDGDADGDEDEENTQYSNDESDSSQSWDVGSTGLAGDQDGALEIASLNSSAIYWAIEHKRLATLRLAESAGVSLDDFRLARLAVATNCLPIIEYLVSKNPDHLEAPCDCFLVKVACSNGHVAAARKLFELGATISYDPQSVLAALFNHLFDNYQDPSDLVSLLLANGADINAPIADNLTSFEYTLNQLTTHATAAILANGASLALTNSKGQPPLTEAIRLPTLYHPRRPELIQSIELLLKNGADPELCDAAGTPPVVTASWLAPAEVVKLLIKHGANVNSKDAQGCTPLLAAAARGEEESVRALLENGATVDAIAPCGCTPLAHACEDGERGTVKALLEKGADFTRVNTAGKTMLHLVAEGRGSVTVALQAFIDRGRALNVEGQQGSFDEWLNKPDHFGRTAVFYAARCGAGTAVRLLISAGAALDTSDIFGATAAFAAARNGHPDSVVAILDACPARIDDLDGFGRKLLDWAVECGPTSLVQLVNSHKGEPVIDKMPTWYPGPMWHAFKREAPSCDICNRPLAPYDDCWTCPTCSKLTTRGLYQVCQSCVERAAEGVFSICLDGDHIARGAVEEVGFVGKGCYLTAGVHIGQRA